MKTIVLAGVATNFGVESTACTSLSAELHALAVKAIFPRIARVVQTGDIEFGAGWRLKMAAEIQ